MKVICKRCGKTLEILKDGDGVHTCSPKYPWPMDMPVEDIEDAHLSARSTDDDGMFVRYLVERLKLAEANATREALTIDMV